MPIDAKYLPKEYEEEFKALNRMPISHKSKDRKRVIRAASSKKNSNFGSQSSVSCTCKTTTCTSQCQCTVQCQCPTQDRSRVSSARYPTTPAPVTWSDLKPSCSSRATSARSAVSVASRAPNARSSLYRLEKNTRRFMSMSSMNSIDSIDLSDDDTDLENETPRSTSSTPPLFSSQNIYKNVCERYSVLPSSLFTDQLGENAIKMADSALGSKQFKAMMVPLVNNTIVTSIDFSGNCIGDAGVVHLCEMLQENVYINNVNVSSNNLGISSAKELSEALKTNRHLTKLDASGNAFQEDAAQFFAEALKESYVLKELNLSHNEFREMAGVYLGDALAVNDTLEVLDLSWNHLRLKGAIALSDGVKHNQGLKKLDLSWNGFGIEGAHAIGAALKHNATLEELDLSNNRINVEGLAAFAKPLKENNTLKIIKLNGNPITTAGAWLMLSVVRGNIANNNLLKLELLSVSVSYQFMALKAEVRALKPELEILHGDFVHSEDSYAKNFVEKDAYHANPMYLLMTHIRESGLRILDLFSQFDKNSDWSITKEEFLKGIRMAGLVFSEAQLDELMSQIDVNNSGDIDYGELMESSKKFRLKMRRRMMTRAKNKANSSFMSLVEDVMKQKDAYNTGTLPEIIKEASAGSPSSSRPQSSRPQSSRKLQASTRPTSGQNKSGRSSSPAMKPPQTGKTSPTPFSVSLDASPAKKDPPLIKISFISDGMLPKPFYRSPSVSRPSTPEGLEDNGMSTATDRPISAKSDLPSIGITLSAKSRKVRDSAKPKLKAVKALKDIKKTKGSASSLDSNEKTGQSPQSATQLTSTVIGRRNSGDLAIQNDRKTMRQMLVNTY